MNWLTGFHAVEEALAAGRALDRIVIARGRHGERVEAVVQLAKAKGVPVRFEDRVQIDRLVGSREHQGVAALGAAKPAMGLEDLLAAQSRRDCWCCSMASRIRIISARLCAQRWRRARTAS